MRIIGCIDYKTDVPVHPKFLADNMNLQLFGWKGTVHTVPVHSVEFDRYGLVFVGDSYPATNDELLKCLTHFEAEIRRERDEALDEFSREEDDVSEEPD